MDRRYVVTNDAGIPFGNQTAMAREEAEAWIEHDMQECRDLGMNTSREDYGILDIGEWEEE